MKPKSLLYNACPRCRGTLYVESGDTATLPEEVEYSCLSCGFTISYEIVNNELRPFTEDKRLRRR